jgi:hypothetical protein
LKQFENFTIGKASMIMDDIINGEADKEDAQQLLNYIAYLKKNNLPIPKMLDDFYKERLEQFFLQNKSYAQSIGLKKSRGRPNDKHNLILEISWVIETILNGDNKTNSIKLAAKKFHKSTSAIEEVFDKYKDEALLVVRLKRATLDNGLTQFDLEKLKKYFM